MVATLAEDRADRAYHVELRALIDEIAASTVR
jgi:hypothetical protein